jgi:hypothetical protein
MIAATGEKLSFGWYVVALNIVTIASLSLLRFFHRRPRLRLLDDSRVPGT